MFDGYFWLCLAIVALSIISGHLIVVHYLPGRGPLMRFLRLTCGVLCIVGPLTFWLCVRGLPRVVLMLWLLSGAALANQAVAYFLTGTNAKARIVRYTCGALSIGLPLTAWMYAEGYVVLVLPLWLPTILAGAVTCACYLVDEACRSGARGGDLKENGYGDHSD